MAKLLYPGTDVWLNNPLRPLEACGTELVGRADEDLTQHHVRDDDPPMGADPFPEGTICGRSGASEELDPDGRVDDHAAPSMSDRASSSSLS